MTKKNKKIHIFGHLSSMFGLPPVWAKPPLGGAPKSNHSLQITRQPNLQGGQLALSNYALGFKKNPGWSPGRFMPSVHLPCVGPGGRSGVGDDAWKPVN